MIDPEPWNVAFRVCSYLFRRYYRGSYEWKDQNSGEAFFAIRRAMDRYKDQRKEDLIIRDFIYDHCP